MFRMKVKTVKPRLTTKIGTRMGQAWPLGVNRSPQRRKGFTAGHGHTGEGLVFDTLREVEFDHEGGGLHLNKQRVKHFKAQNLWVE